MQKMRRTLGMMQIVGVTLLGTLGLLIRAKVISLKNPILWVVIIFNLVTIGMTTFVRIKSGELKDGGDIAGLLFRVGMIVILIVFLFFVTFFKL